MLVPLSWLREYVDWDLPTTELDEALTNSGLEVTGIETTGDWWDPEALRVGRVVGVHPHPDADRLVLVDVDDGRGDPERVVTGAPNLFRFRGTGELPVLKVAFARAGTTLVDAYSEERPRPRRKLKASKIRGVRSAGMVCSELELGLSEEHEGILLLPEDAPVGTPLTEYLRDETVELDLTPDMARGLSMIGVAREVAALTGGRLKALPDCSLPDPDTSEPQVELAIEDPELCARYVAVAIEDVQVGPSPAWMQQRLAQAGVRAINNIVDITNYAMLEWGQPLHAFDLDLLRERNRDSAEELPCITVRTARPGEQMRTLDGQQRELTESLLLIADRAGPIAIAGVMGGAETEVSADTRSILLESATFDGINNRRTSQALRLHSEASQRFTRGVPARMAEAAAGRAARLICELTGGRMAGPAADLYVRRQEEPGICLTAGEVKRQLGMQLDLDTIREALHRLDIEAVVQDDIPDDIDGEGLFGLFREADEPVLVCTPPWFRLDLRIPADLTEEVARIVGYGDVGLTWMREQIPGHEPNHLLDSEERIRDLLSGIGLQEIVGYSYSSPEHHLRLSRHATGDWEPDFVRLANPLSPQRSVMRRDLLVSALEHLVHNLRYEDRLAAFEIGLEFRPELGTAPFPAELRKLQFVLTGTREVGDFRQPTGEDTWDFYDLKGILELLFSRLNLDHRITWAAAQDHRYGPYCARIELDGEPIGLAGELHPLVRSAWDLDGRRVVVGNVELPPLVAPSWQVKQMQAISPYPSVIEDMAFQMDRGITAQAVVQAIRQAGSELLTNIELFDLYAGEPLPPGTKSLAWRLTYQAVDRSLNDKEVARLRRRIARTVEHRTGAVLREG